MSHTHPHSHVHPHETLMHRTMRLWRRRKWYVVPAMTLALVFSACGLFFVLASRMQHGTTLPWDDGLLRALRRADDPAMPIGPSWLVDVSFDATALGSPLVLGIVMIASIGFMYFEGQKRVAMITTFAAGGGALLSLWLKYVFARPRPEIVPHLRFVDSASFPSGHSMGAAVVYLTLGVMFMKSFRSREAKAFCVLLALGLTMTVGASRVYLGVHYPSDVLAGWLAGAAWALACWSLNQFIPSRPLPEIDDTPGEKKKLHD